MAKKNTYRIFQILLMAYLIAAFSWWTILLLQKNREAHLLKQELYSVNDQAALDRIDKEYRRSQLMIIGEGFVFAISILVSLLLINRAFWTEIRTNKKLNNFLLSVTHELKTPIASLKLINRTLASKKLEEHKTAELLDTAFEESLRLENLVNNILTVTQMDNEYRFNFEKLHLEEFLRARMRKFEKLYPQFSFELSAQGESSIEADQEYILRLSDNLIDNAIKYSGDDKQINIQLTSTGDHVTMAISDLGIGIPPEERSKILDKFYRIGNEEMRDSKGTGLGLFIVKEICNAHKAILKIKENTPKGSIFEIKFPVSQS